MSPRVCVFGLWHLGSVTAACLAGHGFSVVGFDLDTELIERYRAGEVPVAEPGLADLVRVGLDSGQLSFTSRPEEALAGADILWVTFDAPVDEDDRGDYDFVRAQLDRVRPFVSPNTLVLLSSQVPVGFGRAVERVWLASEPSLQFASLPENLRLGNALRVFNEPDRIVVGLGSTADQARIQAFLETWCERIVWMSSLESAEMTKHALNGFLALSVAFTNELARICERVGADAADVERGLRSEVRIGQRAYVTAGAPIAGGTLARDVAFLNSLAVEHGLEAPVLHGVEESNRLHLLWMRDRVTELLDGIDDPRVALLGLTYKPGTDTLRRSSALELADWLVERGADVRAFDPAIAVARPETARLTLATDLAGALAEADLAVLATPWPEFKQLEPEQLASGMRHARFIDQAGFVPHLAGDPRVDYVRVGYPRRAAVAR